MIRSIFMTIYRSKRRGNPSVVHDDLRMPQSRREEHPALLRNDRLPFNEVLDPDLSVTRYSEAKHLEWCGEGESYRSTLHQFP